jgi:hypothetical protein
MKHLLLILSWEPSKTNTAVLFFCKPTGNDILRVIQTFINENTYIKILLQ